MLQCKYTKKNNEIYLKSIMKKNEDAIKSIDKFNKKMGSVPYIDYIKLINRIYDICNNYEECIRLLAIDNLEEIDLEKEMDYLDRKTYEDTNWTWYLDDEDYIKVRIDNCATHKVRCKNTGELFNNNKEAGEWCGLKNGNSIGRCVRGGAKSAGKHPITGEKLTWEYVIEYRSII